MKTILIMAGGTGGHIFPALAVAEELRRQGVAVHWLGTEQGMENELVSKAQFSITYISIGRLRGKGWKKWMLLPITFTRALFQAIRSIKKINPDVVLGMGGFVSAPGGLAAKCLRKPLIIHEQNAVPGLTNRFLALFANAVLEPFPNTFSARRRVTTVGNPVRLGIRELPAPAERSLAKHKPLHLLVLGGSQGARVLNETLPKAISILTPEERPFIWHQTGKGHLEDTKRLYHFLNISVQLDSFIENMAEAYAWADLVVCRAGALTLAELMAAGVGSILIPYPYAADNHQIKNAEHLVKAKAAVMLLQNDLTPARLAETLRQLLSHEKQLLQLAENARQLYLSDAVEKIIEHCQKVSGKIDFLQNLE